MPTPADVLAEADLWIGTRENPDGSNRVAGITDWYYGTHAPWCAMFVSRVYWNVGVPLPASTEKGFSWVSAGADWMRAQGWKIPTRDAGPADVLCFEWGTTPGGYDHVGLAVNGVDANGYLLTVEGNIGNRVQYLRRHVSEIPETFRVPLTPTAPPAPSLPPKEKRMIAATLTAEGSIVEFRARPQDGLIVHRWQVTPGGEYVPWELVDAGPTPGSFDSVEVVTNADGRLELWAWLSWLPVPVPFRTWQTRPGGSWVPWVNDA